MSVPCKFYCFNRRGDSLGGATCREQFPQWQMGVSIAEAILWGEQHVGLALTRYALIVSIAEAILWGEQQPEIKRVLDEHVSFNRRGDSLGGATGGRVLIYVLGTKCFNRRGDSLGGATVRWEHFLR